MDEDTLEFDMVGIDAAIANAFRRILLAEVLEDVGWRVEIVSICRRFSQSHPSGAGRVVHTYDSLGYIVNIVSRI
jgi:hypothetical protein